MYMCDLHNSSGSEGQLSPCSRAENETLGRPWMLEGRLEPGSEGNLPVNHKLRRKRKISKRKAATYIQHIGGKSLIAT